MICEKCGNEISQNEKVCPYCGGEENIAGIPVSAPEELGVPVVTTVRKKRGTARIVIGIVSLVMAAAFLVISFLSPVLLIGSWKMSQTMPTGMGVDFKVESTMEFTFLGKLTLADNLVNWEELGYPEDQSSFSSDFNYSVKNGSLMLTAIPQEGEEGQSADSIEMRFDVTPGQFSYWQGDTIPREVYDYQRVGWIYPSMILWIASGAFLMLGVLFLAIPGKKHEIITYEEKLDDAEEAEDLDEFLEEIYEEIEAEDEAVSEEIMQVTEEVVTESKTDKE